jgi:hypothetical protein
MNRDSLINLSISIASLVVTVLLLETVTRVLRGEYSWVNFLEVELSSRAATPAEFSKELGWIPRPGYASDKVKILEDSTRSNGNTEVPAGADTILAVGDSFTFGDEVADAESWPAFLERRSGYRVINGGVFAYGTDQTFIRMQALAEQKNPSLIIFSLIPDDIRRTQYARRGTGSKPYFELSPDNELRLVNDHVARPQREGEIDSLRHWLGYSLFAHRIMRSLLPEYWYTGGMGRHQVHVDGVAITCRIFEHLNDYVRSEGAPIIVLLQYSKSDFAAADQTIREELNDLQTAAACLDSEIVEVVDLYEPLMNLKSTDPERFDSLYKGHMTGAGNEFVASVLWQTISEKQVLRRP